MIIILAISLPELPGCTSSDERELQIAYSQIEKGEFKEAIQHLERAKLRNPSGSVGVTAAREAAKISFYEVKDFKKAAEFYSHLVLHSKDASERLNSQKQLASIYFEHLTDYNKSIFEINKLLTMNLPEADKLNYKLLLARCYFYLNNFNQAENEVDEYLKSEMSDETRISLLLLKGNITLAKKELPKAALIFKEIIDRFPERAKKENVGLTLAVTYEEMKDYSNAIQTLLWVKNYHAFPEYIDLRIKRLKERQENQPGAKGFRK